MICRLYGDIQFYLQVSVAAVDSQGRTALHYCTEHEMDAICSLLLKADRNIIDIADREGYTALHLAVLARNQPMIDTLLAEGASIDIADNEGHTLMHLATGEILH